MDDNFKNITNSEIKVLEVKIKACVAVNKANSSKQQKVMNLTNKSSALKSVAATSIKNVEPLTKIATKNTLPKQMTTVSIQFHSFFITPLNITETHYFNNRKIFLLHFLLSNIKSLQRFWISVKNLFR
jgi:hypothetical protein